MRVNRQTRYASGCFLVLLALFGCEAKNPESERLSESIGTAVEELPSGSAQASEEELTLPDIVTHANPPPACSLLQKANAAVLVAGLIEVVVDEPRQCRLQAPNGAVVVLVWEKYATLPDALARFQQTGDSISAPEGIGTVALVRRDSSEVLTLGAFLHGWQLSLSAPATERQLTAVGARLVDAVAVSGPGVVTTTGPGSEK